MTQVVLMQRKRTDQVNDFMGSEAENPLPVSGLPWHEVSGLSWIFLEDLDFA